MSNEIAKQLINQTVHAIPPSHRCKKAKKQKHKTHRIATVGLNDFKVDVPKKPVKLFNNTDLKGNKVKLNGKQLAASAGKL